MFVYYMHGWQGIMYLNCPLLINSLTDLMTTGSDGNIVRMFLQVIKYPQCYVIQSNQKHVQDVIEARESIMLYAKLFLC